MLSFTYKTLMLSVIILNVVMLSVVAPSKQLYIIAINNLFQTPASSNLLGQTPITCRFFKRTVCFFCYFLVTESLQTLQFPSISFQQIYDSVCLSRDAIYKIKQELCDMRSSIAVSKIHQLNAFSASEIGRVNDA